MSDIVNGFSRGARGPTVDPRAGSTPRSENLPSAVESAKEAIRVLEQKAAMEQWTSTSPSTTEANLNAEGEQLKELAKDFNGPEK